MHPKFIAALFIIAKTWKQPKHLSTNECIKKMWYTMEYYTGITKNEIMSFAATWMDVEIIILSKVSQTDKDKYHITYMQNLKKMIQINLFTKQEQTHRHRKQTYSYQRGKVWRRDKLGIWKLHIHTAIY